MKLNKEQYRAAHHKDGPMLVLAGPGSGKTHLLVERIRIMIEEYNIPPDNILVITFSRKAARQMQARFEKRVEDRSYPVTFGTFHAVFYHILQDHDPTTNRLISEEERQKLIANAAAFCGISLPCSEKDDIEALSGHISAYKNFGEEEYFSDGPGSELDIDEKDDIRRLICEYDRLCRKEGFIDFDDMIINCRQLFARHEMILRRWQKKFRYFLVDEFQDINQAQYDVLRLLAGDAMNVFAVGDDDQAIYRFRGACPGLMKKFTQQYRGCRRVDLTMNYRCSENIIGAADTLVRNNKDRFERQIQRHLPSARGGIVEIVHSENTVVQAAFVCDRIEELIDAGCDPWDIAVLYRSSHCVKMFEKTAGERGLAVKDTDGISGVYKRRLKIHEAYSKAHNGNISRRDFFLIMNNPDRGLSREALCNSNGDYIGDLKRYYADSPQMLDKVFDLERTIMSYDVNEFPNDTTDKKDMVNIMTAHASKGLEFRCVFVIGLQEGLFPHHKNMTGSSVEEERRLMYVAMTRAKQQLYLCTLGTMYGKRESRFAAEAAKNRKYISDIIHLTRL